MSDIFTPDRPYNTTLTDSAGDRWHFAYWGSKNIYIRQHDGTGSFSFGPTAVRDDWPYLIGLDGEDIRPGDIAAEWIDDRAAQWIRDRNADLSAGNL